jgi:hypothetical protein
MDGFFGIVGPVTLRGWGFGCRVWGVDERCERDQKRARRSAGCALAGTLKRTTPEP